LWGVDALVVVMNAPKKRGKRCENSKKAILTSEGCAEQNTQQVGLQPCFEVLAKCESDSKYFVLPLSLEFLLKECFDP
jgi:hypothetical protein